MGKRFTDTAKFDDAWFYALPPAMKLAWDLILAKCDAAGVWSPNFSLAANQIGMKVDWQRFLKEADGRIVVLRGGKWWVTTFIPFQYGRLSRAARVHMAVINLLEGHGIKVDANGIAIPSGWEKDKDKEQEKDNAGEEMQEEGGGGAEESSLPHGQAEAIYAEYPKKAGRQEALRQIRAALKGVPHARLLERTRAYAEAVGRWPTEERKFVPDPERWFRKGRWDDDPQTWEPAKVNGSAGLDKSKTVGLRPEEMPTVMTFGKHER